MKCKRRHSVYYLVAAVVAGVVLMAGWAVLEASSASADVPGYCVGAQKPPVGSVSVCTP